MTERQRVSLRELEEEPLTVFERGKTLRVGWKSGGRLRIWARNGLDAGGWICKPSRRDQVCLAHGNVAGI